MLFSCLIFSCRSGKNPQDSLILIENRYEVWHGGMGSNRGVLFAIYYHLEKGYELKDPILKIGTHSLPMHVEMDGSRQVLLADFTEHKEGGQDSEFPAGSLFDLSPFKNAALQVKIDDNQMEFPIESFSKRKPKHLIP